MKADVQVKTVTESSAERYGMVIDLNRCVGCQTCTIACKHANDTPPGVQWRRVLDVETGTFPDVERLFLVTGCQHCAEPPCVPVCPSGATRQRADGLVTMDYDLCIGCASCAVACPYQARTIVHDKAWFYGQETAQETAVAHDDRLGVAQKCTFCVGRVDEAREKGLTPGVDLDVTPACSASCIAQAISFGDFNDPDSNVSRQVADNPSFQMHAELGTDPQIKYLYEAPAIPGREPLPDDADDEHMSDPSNPLVGERQTFWDFRAAMNFVMGGMSAGLAVTAYFAHLWAGLSEQALIAIYGAAGAAMAIGLFFVFLKIGRKARFLYVLLRPQSSWMTRETYAVAVFYPALGAELLWPGAALHGIAALAAAVFLFCQARILYASKGIPAWRVSLMPWMLIATGLLEGTGVLAAVGLLAPQAGHSAAAIAAAGILLIAVNAGLWHFYRTMARDWGIGPLSRRDIRRITPALHLGGHLLPAVLFLGALGLDLGSVGTHLAMAAAGVAAVIGGALWKFTVITRACHQQGFALAKFPQRGSGTRAAPALKPLNAD
ncbi:MAG: 4Fe-4S dicluster domain-containing protein [Sphingomonadales bacterium]